MMITMNSPHIVQDGQVFRYIETPMFMGYEPDRMFRPGQAWLTYRGGKISLEQWTEILAFFKWSFDTHKSESQVRLYYNQITGEWKAWAFPQKSFGMTVKEYPEHPNTEEDHEQFDNNWVQFGTVHHHCSTGAFQSGTDHKDENPVNGIHITVGDLDKQCYSLHARLSRHGTFYGVHMFNWFQCPEPLETYPNSVKDAFLNAVLTMPPENLEFPDRWEENFIKNTYNSRASVKEEGYFMKGVRKIVRKTGISEDRICEILRMPIKDEEAKATEKEKSALRRVRSLARTWNVSDDWETATLIKRFDDKYIELELEAENMILKNGNLLTDIERQEIVYGGE